MVGYLSFKLEHLCHTGLEDVGQVISCGPLKYFEEKPIKIDNNNVLVNEVADLWSIKVTKHNLEKLIKFHTVK